MADKIKYDSKYISYVKDGNSAAVFIIRDIVKSIDTKRKWIDIIEKKGNKNRNKTRTVEKIRNQKFKQYVPNDWARSSDCILVKKNYSGKTRVGVSDYLS